ncbi:MucBP domain-containing protein, partial [Streptococcus saliviloxodontae]|uniref:MucBP domain-containing protein n=1 Tax=Streptococcus saliviloxodontae TaxID=1349416 RepID=UPI003643B980
VYREVVTPKGDVVVHYVDESGNVIKNPVVDTPTSDVDTPYDTTDNKPRIIEFNGKKYEIIPTKTQGNETGKVVEGRTEITYVYREVVTPKGDVVVHYVDESGNVIKNPVVDTPTSDVDTPYDTTDNKPRIIEFNGKKYEIIKVIGKEVGTVHEGTTTITYVYREIVEPAAVTPTAQPTATRPTTVAPTAKVSAKASLPATGEKESGLAYIGAALLAATGLIFKRRKNNDQE